VQRFYVPRSFTDSELLTLSTEESHHVVRVMRMDSGNSLSLVNGRGDLALAVIETADAKRCTVRVVSVSGVPNANRVHVCFSIPKSTALDFIIRRCTEIGVASFQPLISQHSLHGGWNPQRWQRIVVEVGKQCQEAHFPVVHPPIAIGEWLKIRAARPLIFCSEQHRAVGSVGEKFDAYDLLVGAEGGWSEKEITDVLAVPARLFGLGTNRLRAETAALVSTILLKKETGELQTVV
jgi:16S rRNA (uracil1498-N3)-methyltransferase